MVEKLKELKDKNTTNNKSVTKTVNSEIYKKIYNCQNNAWQVVNGERIRKNSAVTLNYYSFLR